MRITVKVIAGSKKQGIEVKSEFEWVVKVRAQATEGKANFEVLEAIARKLNIPKKRVTLFSGAKSKLKIIEIS